MLRLAAVGAIIDLAAVGGYLYVSRRSGAKPREMLEKARKQATRARNSYEGVRDMAGSAVKGAKDAHKAADKLTE